MSTTINTEKTIQEYDFLRLRYTNHATERLKERTTGQLIVAPTIIKLNKDNVVSFSYVEDEATAVVKIFYKKDIDMFLCISIKTPKFAIVKTVYFKNVKKNSSKKRKNWIKTEQISEKIEMEQTLLCGECTEDVANVPRDMGGEKISRWKKLLRAIRRMVGLGA